MIIDIHNHTIPIAVMDALRQGWFDGHALADSGKKTELMIDGEWAGSVPPERWDLDLRVEAMDQMGVQVQALTLMPQLQGYRLPVDQAVRLCRLVNDSIAETAASRPNRFVALGIVPLQDPVEAVRELRRLSEELNLTGLEIGANVAGEDPADERFFPFWEAVADLDLLVFVHPISTTLTGSERMADYHLSNVIGNPLDTSVFTGNMIFGGHLERWPGLKICPLPRRSVRSLPDRSLRPRLQGASRSAAGDHPAAERIPQALPL